MYRSDRTLRGQSLVELAAASGIIMVALLGCVALFSAQWKRARCAYLAFESAHSALIGRKSLGFPMRRPNWRFMTTETRTEIQEDQQSVRAVKSCGKIQEQVRLLKLEPSP